MHIGSISTHKINTTFPSQSLATVCLQKGSCLTYDICVCLHIVVSNTYCVVLYFCLSSYCVPYTASFSGLSILIAHSVFSNVYLLVVVVGCPLPVPIRYVLVFMRCGNLNVRPLAHHSTTFIRISMFVNLISS